MEKQVDKTKIFYREGDLMAALFPVIKTFSSVMLAKMQNEELLSCIESGIYLLILFLKNDFHGASETIMSTAF